MERKEGAEACGVEVRGEPGHEYVDVRGVHAGNRWRLLRVDDYFIKFFLNKKGLLFVIRAFIKYDETPHIHTKMEQIQSPFLRTETLQKKKTIQRS